MTSSTINAEPSAVNVVALIVRISLSPIAIMEYQFAAVPRASAVTVPLVATSGLNKEPSFLVKPIEDKV